MKKIAIYFLLLTGLAACNKDEFANEDLTQNQPQFYVEGTVDGAPFKYVAGLNSVHHEAGYSIISAADNSKGIFMQMFSVGTDQLFAIGISRVLTPGVVTPPRLGDYQYYNWWNRPEDLGKAGIALDDSLDPDKTTVLLGTSCDTSSYFRVLSVEPYKDPNVNSSGSRYKVTAEGKVKICSSNKVVVFKSVFLYE